MSALLPERLYQLLPEIYRVRDGEQGEPLRALLAVVEAELERVEADIAGLYDNWFIETCDDWVVPYIGDLLGARPVRAIPSAKVSARAYVANTIAYRRRKGTAVVLEQLARDTTGWPARAVEFFARLTTTQHMNHVRLAAPATAGVRNAAIAELADSAFETCAHTAEVRGAGTRGGRYNLSNVGIFLWRLRSYAIGAGEPGEPLADFTSARDRGGWWSLHPAGRDAPLFNRPRSEAKITHLAEEDNVPGPLRRLALHAELDRPRRGVTAPAPRFMTPDDPVLRLWVRLSGEPDPVEVKPQDIYLCQFPRDLVVDAIRPCVALDPERGRLDFPPGLVVNEVWVQSSYGFSGDLGGGPYDRGDAVRAASRSVATGASAASDRIGFFAPDVWQIGVSHRHVDDGSGTLFPSLRAAVAAWNLQPAGRAGVILLMDSLSEKDVPDNPAQPLEIRIAEGSQLLILAGERPQTRQAGQFTAKQVRAHWIGDLVVRGTGATSTGAGACFINGLLLEGELGVAPGNLGQLALAHSTLIPGASALVVQPPAPGEPGGNEQLALTIERSICATVSVPGPISGIRISDSIVDAGGGAPTLAPTLALEAPETALDLQRCTFFGGVAAQSLTASDCLFAAPVQAQRRQVGCVRFSYMPPGSLVPRRYRCQPDLETAARIATLREAARRLGGKPTPAEEDALTDEVAALVQPLFVSRRWGDPAYGQLEQRCAPQIRTGAESGAEMGAFEFLQQPQREANLRDALDEYLPFGLEAGLFFVT